MLKTIKPPRSLRNLVSSALAISVMMISTASYGFLIDSTTAINTSWTIDYELLQGVTDPNGNNNTNQDITGTVVFELLGFNTTTDILSLKLTASNTSTDLTNEVGLQKLAFGTDPDAILITFIDAADNGFISGDLHSSPELTLGNTLSLDVESVTGNGANRSLREGESDMFQLDLTFSDLTSSGVNFDPFSSKWQTAYGSFEFAGTPPATTPPPPPPPQGVPEPNILTLLGLGIIGLRFISKQK